MTTNEQSTQPRLLTSEELAALVKLHRSMRQWSQEQLAEIAGLNPRTVQRAEDGQPVSLDTRRALAGAFGLDDIDALNKPYLIPTAQQMAAEKGHFERERVTLEGTIIASGKQLAQLIEPTMASMFSEAADMPQVADELYARITDYCREYQNCSELYSAQDKLLVHAELNDLIKGLAENGFSLVGASRVAVLKTQKSDAGFKAGILYVVAFPKGQEAENLAVPREVSFR